MRQICAEAEAYRRARPPAGPPAPLAGFVEPITEAAVDAACLVAQRLDAPLIVVATESGRTALALSNRRPAATILAVTRTEQLARIAAVCWGVTAVVQPEPAPAERDLAFATGWAKARGLVNAGQYAVFVRGQVPGEDSSRALLARRVG